MKTIAHVAATASNAGVSETPRVASFATPTRTMLLMCGVVSPVIYAVTDIVAAKLYRGYSYYDQAVSELFAIDAPTSSFVVPLFTLSSVLLFAFGLGVRLAARNRAQRWLAFMFMGSAIDAIALWNFFPMHMRGLERSATDAMHLALATNPFVLGSFVLAAIARGKWFRVYTIITIVGLLALAWYGFSFAPALATNAPTPWMGLAERIAQYGGGLWQAGLAAILIRERPDGKS